MTYPPPHLGECDLCGDVFPIRNHAREPVRNALQWNEAATQLLCPKCRRGVLTETPTFHQPVKTANPSKP